MEPTQHSAPSTPPHSGDANIAKVQSSCSLTTTPDQKNRVSHARVIVQDLESHEARIVLTLGNAIQALAKQKTYNPATDNPLSLSFAGKAKISLVNYFSRIIKYINQLKPSTGDNVSSGMRALIMAVLYTDRISQTCPSFVITSANVHRLYLVAMMEATKVIEDSPMSATFWAKVGGISSKELVQLENCFCQILDYDFHVEEEEFWCYHSRFSLYCDRKIVSTMHTVAVPTTTEASSPQGSPNSRLLVN